MYLLFNRQKLTMTHRRNTTPQFLLYINRILSTKERNLYSVYSSTNLELLSLRLIHIYSDESVFRSIVSCKVFPSKSSRKSPTRLFMTIDGQILLYFSKGVVRFLYLYQWSLRKIEIPDTFIFNQVNYGNLPEFDNFTRT